MRGVTFSQKQAKLAKLEVAHDAMARHRAAMQAGEGAIKYVDGVLMLATKHGNVCLATLLHNKGVLSLPHTIISGLNLAMTVHDTDRGAAPPPRRPPPRPHRKRVDEP